MYDALPDIVLDVPAAYTLLERFAGMCHREGVLSTPLFRELPQRSVALTNHEHLFCESVVT